jgi:hypothetical protein
MTHQVREASGQYLVNLELQKVFQRFSHFTHSHCGPPLSHQLPSRISGRSPSPEPLPPHQRPLTGVSRPATAATAAGVRCASPLASPECCASARRS